MKRKRRSPPSEDSIRLRAVALGAVMVAVIALIAQGAVDGTTAVGALLLVPAGFVFSYVRRARRNTILKIGLAAALFVVLGSFLHSVRQAPSVDDARVALASMFLWTQVLHSFDLPRRRDLAFSVVSSVILMTEAGSLSLGSGFALFLFPYAVLAGAWLYLTHRIHEEELALSFPVARGGSAGALIGGGMRGGRGVLRVIAGITAAVTLAGAVAFLGTPRVKGLRIVAPPFSIGRRVPVPGFNGGVVNRGLPAQAGDTPSSLTGGYPGFGTAVDLGVRWQLSDRVVMKVRAQQAAFWRAQAYDHFDGHVWTASDSTVLERHSVSDAPIRLARFDGAIESTVAGGRTTELTQTFYILAAQPNVVLAAYQPRDLYFPLKRVVLDSYGSVRTALFLEGDTIYSVVSDIPVPTVEELRSSPHLPTDLPAEDLQRYREFLDRYTQVPVGLSPRVAQLAHAVTASSGTTYDAVVAVEDWLRANIRYNADIPPDPPRSDPVDEFLFHRRQGYCEHFSTAMVMLLRSLGIPSRIAVGFGTGERNPFTGYFEVRESDAHSWVEVFYPWIGWMEYDPTHDVPEANPGLAGWFIAPQVLRAVGRFFARNTPRPVKAVMSAVAGGVAVAARLLFGSWPSLWLAAALTAMAVALGLALRRRGRSVRGPPGPPSVEAFRSMCRTFEARGRPRLAHRTPKEHLLALLAEDRLAAEAREDLELIVSAFEHEAFSGQPVAQDRERRAHRAAEHLRELAGTRPR
jgi:transglutaminase-like putative cysteine protease